MSFERFSASTKRIWFHRPTIDDTIRYEVFGKQFAGSSAVLEKAGWKHPDREQAQKIFNNLLTEGIIVHIQREDALELEIGRMEEINGAAGEANTNLLLKWTADKNNMQTGALIETAKQKNANAIGVLFNEVRETNSALPSNFRAEHYLPHAVAVYVREHAVSDE